MRCSRLGSSGLVISSLSLGGMTFGSQVDESLAFRMLDLAFDGGINFFDTAEIYSSPSTAETYGRSEEILGRWVSSKPRDAVVVATEIAGAADWPSAARLTHIRGGRFVLDRHHIVAAVEASLRRLGLEWIDLYQSHWPDRLTPMEEQLEALTALQRAGKIRYYGLSMETPWGVAHTCAVAQTERSIRPVSVQGAYNLLQRQFELGMEEVCREERVGMIAFSPLAMGLLTGKYSGSRPADSRLTRFNRYGDLYLKENMIGMADRYVGVARRHGLDPAQMAYAWTASRSGVATILTSASRLEQIEPFLRSADVTLSDEVLRELDDIRSLHDARWNVFG